MANALILHGLFAEFPTRRKFGAEFDPEQGIRIREQGIWRSPENPNPARLCGARARLAAAALAGAAAASLDR